MNTSKTFVELEAPTQKLATVLLQEVWIVSLSTSVPMISKKKRDHGGCSGKFYKFGRWNFPGGDKKRDALRQVL